MTAPEPGTRQRALRKSAELAAKSAAAAMRAANEEEEPGQAEAKPGAQGGAEREVEEALEEVPTNAIVDFWRYKLDGTREWCGQMEAKDFSILEVGRRAGGGRYKCIFRTPSTRPGHKYDMAGYRWVDISANIKPAELSVVPAAAAAPASGLPDLSKFLEGFGEMVKAQIASSLEAQGRVAEMQGALVTKMNELARPTTTESPMERLLEKLLPAILAKPEPAKDQLGVRDILELMKEFRERPAAAGGELERALSLMGKMREVFGGEGEGGPAWLGPVEKGLGIIQDAMKRREGTAGTGGQPMPVVPALGPVPAAPAGEVSRETPPAEGGPAPVPEHPLLKLLAPYVPQLIGHATADHDPDLWAGVMLEMIPPGYHGTVLELVSAADITEQFTAGFPSAAPFAAWFKEFFTAARERLTPESDHS